MYTVTQYVIINFAINSHSAFFSNQSFKDFSHLLLLLAELQAITLSQNQFKMTNRLSVMYTPEMIFWAKISLTRVHV